MILSKNNNPRLRKTNLSDLQGELPVKVLQFGAGVLLRGLPDYLIDKANRQGIFNGKIIIVKSTSHGNTDVFAEQDSLYTILVKGIKDGRRVEKATICEAISGIYDASSEWDKVLKEMENPQLQIILSNTTEVGIQLIKEDIHQQPPASFPAKLLAVLYYRYKFFKGSDRSGLTIIPTELLPENGRILKGILSELIIYNNLESDFMEWLDHANWFCNSLVDRIVPGKLDPIEEQEFEEAHGYTDNLLVTAEPYLLWAIEGNEKVKEILSFEAADEGVVVVPDITRYRELKLRLLNGTHTLLCGLAVQSGFQEVNSAMENIVFQNYFDEVTQEISVAIPYEIDQLEKERFISSVRDRFRNPYIKHLWINICVEYTAKLRMRVVPMVLEYLRRYQEVPHHMAVGFAAYLVFMRSEKHGNEFCGNAGGESYVIKDSHAGYLNDVWKNTDPSEIAATVLANCDLWGTDLTEKPGFTEAVQAYMEMISRSPKAEIITRLSSKK